MTSSFKNFSILPDNFLLNYLIYHYAFETIAATLTCVVTLVEQQFFEKVQRLEQSQEQFVTQTEQHHKLREEFTKISKWN